LKESLLIIQPIFRGKLALFAVRNDSRASCGLHFRRTVGYQKQKCAGYLRGAGIRAHRYYIINSINPSLPTRQSKKAGNAVGHLVIKIFWANEAVFLR